MSKDLHTNSHMSPAQAAHTAGVSRWTIMRAIKSQELLAIRDNRNHWRITPEALNMWKNSTVRTPETLHTSEIDKLREDLSKETSRADVAEALLEATSADRDHWRAMAEKLADGSRKRGWWPWSRRE